MGPISFLKNTSNVSRRHSEKVGYVEFSYTTRAAGGDPIAFSTYPTYLAHVHQARPGDLFYLWSAAEMRRRNLLLAEVRYDHAEQGVNSLLSPDCLSRVRQYLGEAPADGLPNEVLAAVSLGTTALGAIWTDLDGSGWDRLLELAERACVPGGRLCVLPYTTIDGAGFYLVKAKRPNERGEVPLGGAY